MFSFSSSSPAYSYFVSFTNSNNSTKIFIVHLISNNSYITQVLLLVIWCLVSPQQWARVSEPLVIFTLAMAMPTLWDCSKLCIQTNYLSKHKTYRSLPSEFIFRKLRKSLFPCLDWVITLSTFVYYFIVVTFYILSIKVFFFLCNEKSIEF